MSNHDVLVIGAGLAGLSCAMELKANGLDVCVLEASNDVGGRVRTDHHKGFLLDRGFQVLLTGYPEAQRLLDYELLHFRQFYPGAKVRVNDHFETISDPFRRPVGGLLTALGTPGTSSLVDKLRVAKLRIVQTQQERDYFYTQAPDTSTLAWLKAQGFSDRIIDAFFRPFYGGVMLDRSLESSSKMMELTYKYFASGDTVIPAHGMEQIPKQMARAIGRDAIKKNHRVERIDGTTVTLQTGDTMTAKDIVIATDNTWAAGQREEIESIPWKSVTCVYFKAKRPPISEPILVLNGEKEGVVNNLCVLSQIAPSYAPPNNALISVSVLNNDAPNDRVLDVRIRQHMCRWFGAQVLDWENLRTYHIHHAQPNQAPGRLTPVEKPTQLDDHLFICGDHREMASIDGALRSGKRAALSLMAHRQ